MLHRSLRPATIQVFFAEFMENGYFEDGRQKLPSVKLVFLDRPDRIVKNPDWSILFVGLIQNSISLLETNIENGHFSELRYFFIRPGKYFIL